ncbi:DUF3224 domain-containing protein [Shewanella sp. C32]|uniref:DUF3224 domain-containing protein n=1 Tax=Shewanella electrica TaxID=515560 RepID=A0ABT2FFZ8_9GAMM|nr:DUF3224 domain-containing protein [Shewanella electrica]MCH1925013.1 DUF3224 domain-containing protein [Shewanella electrica]MCS4554837.1 DUF3224 domain-containing protein [Shewanella electrica]
MMPAIMSPKCQPAAMLSRWRSTMVRCIVMLSFGGVMLTVTATENPQAQVPHEESTMTTLAVSGSFDVNVEPQQDDDAPAGRMILRKQYHGAMSGVGVGQMLSKRIANGAAAYSAIEEFVGSVDGKQGAFTLVHSGFMNGGEQTLKIYILPGSGIGELSNISGTMDIIQQNGEHQYQLRYVLD